MSKPYVLCFHYEGLEWDQLNEVVSESDCNVLDMPVESPQGGEQA